MALRDAMARADRIVHARTSAFAEDLLYDDGTAPTGIAFRGVVDRSPIVRAADGTDVVLERIRISTTLGGAYGLPAVPTPGKWRVNLPLSVGAAASWARVGEIVSQDESVVVFEVIR